MTRINCIPPSELTRAHLVAEYRELPRVFTLVKRAVERGEKPDDKRNPSAYTLGTGHVRFFYSRLRYLAKRFDELLAEMKSRGYKANIPRQWGQGPSHSMWWNDWQPDDIAMAINRQRIQERLS
jgi:deoxyribonuclease (pyrimidine dimer)